MDWESFDRTVRNAVTEFLAESPYGDDEPEFSPKGKNIVTPHLIAAFMIGDDLMADVCTGTGMSRNNLCGVSVFDRGLEHRSELSRLFQDYPGVGHDILDHLRSIAGIGDDEDEEE